MHCATRCPSSRHEPAVMACSALTPQYREKLSLGLDTGALAFVRTQPHDLCFLIVLASLWRHLFTITHACARAHRQAHSRPATRGRPPHRCCLRHREPCWLHISLCVQQLALISCHQACWIRSWNCCAGSRLSRACCWLCKEAAHAKREMHASVACWVAQRPGPPRMILSIEY